VVCAPHARDAATASLAPVAAAGRKSSGCRLFVGNLAWTTTDQDLQKHIGQVGGVLNAEVALCASNSRSKGYGTVEMATSQDASHAIQTLNNSELHGRSIVVRYDQKAR
jgi:RNA recognition motif-containing protein